MSQRCEGLHHEDDVVCRHAALQHEVVGVARIGLMAVVEETWPEQIIGGMLLWPVSIRDTSDVHRLQFGVLPPGLVKNVLYYACHEMTVFAIEGIQGLDTA